jgi:hypothetical protein
MAESSPIFASTGQSKPSQKPLYYDQADSPKTRAMQITFVTCITIAVVITFIMTIVRAIQEDGLYILLFVSLISEPEPDASLKYNG